MSFLIFIYRRYRIIRIESCIKYFFIQRVGSAVLIRMLYDKRNFIGMMYSLVLRIKIGAGPFYFWFPSMCSGIDWSSCFMLMFFQKVLPLCLIYILIHWIIWIVVLVRLIMGVMGSFNQRGIKELLAYSSVHHLGWILIIRIKGNLRWVLYLLIYGFVLLRVVLLIVKEEVVDFSMMYKCKNKVWFIVRMLRMAGIPPLFGFFLKWMALINVIDLGLLWVIMLVIASVIILYVYVRIIYDVIIGGRFQESWGRIEIMKYMYIGDVIRMIGFLGGLFVIWYVII